MRTAGRAAALAGTMLIMFSVVALIALDTSTTADVGYLSELGRSGADGEATFRRILFGIAAGVGTLAGALVLLSPPRLTIGRVSLNAAACLALTAAGFALAATVPCAGSCDLLLRGSIAPVADIVHIGGAIVAFGSGIVAMMVLALHMPGDAIRLVAVVLVGVVIVAAAVTVVTGVTDLPHAISGAWERVAVGASTLLLLGTGWRLTMHGSMT